MPGKANIVRKEELMLQLLQRQIYVVMHSGLMRRFEYVAALVYQCLVLFIEELIGDSQQPEEEV